MAQSDVIRSYLISLGYDLDANSQRQFENALRDAHKLVEGYTTGIASNLLKWQAEVIGLFSTVSGVIIGTVDKVAMADQEYRLFGERMLMNTRQAREYKMALDALGQPIEAIAFDPELHERFTQLVELQKQMETMLGPDFEQNMRRVRDVRFEFTKLNVELQGLAMVFANDLVKKLGGGENVLDYLQKASSWLLNHIPELADELSTDAVPVLRDMWGIVKDVGDILGVAVNAFTTFEGVITNDDSLQGQTTSFHQFATAVGDAVHQLAVFLQVVLGLEKAGVDVGKFAVHGIASLFTSDQGRIDKLTAAQTQDLKDLASVLRSDPIHNSYDGKGAASQASALARTVGAATGIDPTLIFEQWAHETANFTNRGARDLNNLGGIRKPGSTEYQAFTSLQDFAQYDAKLLARNFPGLAGATNEHDYAAALKRGRLGAYMEDNADNYERGMRRFRPSYNGAPAGGATPSSFSMGDVHVHVTNPGASAQEIADTVHATIERKRRMEMQRALSEAGGAYA